MPLNPASDTVYFPLTVDFKDLGAVTAVRSFKVPFPISTLAYASVDCGTVAGACTLDVKVGSVSLLDAIFTLASDTPAEDYVSKGVQVKPGDQVNVTAVAATSVADLSVLLVFVVGKGGKALRVGDKG